MTNYLITVVGATAIGKTGLSIKLAKHFNTEIISSDSRQFYKEMQIGTAVPSLEDLAVITHHFIQDRSIINDYSVGQFEKDAILKLNELFLKNNRVIMVNYDTDEDVSTEEYSSIEEPISQPLPPLESVSEGYSIQEINLVDNEGTPIEIQNTTFGSYMILVMGDSSLGAVNGPFQSRYPYRSASALSLGCRHGSTVAIRRSRAFVPAESRGMDGTG